MGRCPLEARVNVVCPLLLLLLLLCAAFWTPFSCQAETEEPVIQDWHKNGLLAALKDPSPEVLKSTVLTATGDNEILKKTLVCWVRRPRIRHPASSSC